MTPPTDIEAQLFAASIFIGVLRSVIVPSSFTGICPPLRGYMPIKLSGFVPFTDN
jgi:hypothetical protein